MSKSILKTLIGAAVTAVTAATAFAPAANAGYAHRHVYYKPVYVYVSDCKWVKFHNHYGHHHYKKVCH